MLSLHEQKSDFEIFPRLRYQSSDLVPTRDRNRIIGTLKMKYGNKCSAEDILNGRVTTPPQQSSVPMDSLNIEMLSIHSCDYNEVFGKEKDLGTQSNATHFTRE